MKKLALNDMHRHCPINHMPFKVYLSCCFEWCLFSHLTCFPVWKQLSDFPLSHIHSDLPLSDIHSDFPLYGTRSDFPVYGICSDFPLYGICLYGIHVCILHIATELSLPKYSLTQFCTCSCDLVNKKE